MILRRAAVASAFVSLAAAVAFGGCTGLLGDYSVGGGGASDGSTPTGDGGPDVASGDAAQDTAPGAASLTIDQASRDFGTHVVGSTVTPATFTVTNTGTGPTASLKVAVIPLRPFGASGGTCAGATLQPGKSCTVIVSLDTSAAGSPAATLTVADGPTDVVTSALKASIVTPASMSWAPASNDFGTMDIGSPTTSVTFMLKNLGGSTTPTITVGLGGSNPGDFGTSGDGCSGKPLAPGATCNVDVVFKPTARGPRAASLTATAGGTAPAQVSGVGRDYVTLSVTKTGSGAGTVTGDQINCGPTCSEQVARTTVADPTVTLTATPDANSAFNGWTGGGCGSSGTCTITMNGNQSVSVDFKANCPVVAASALHFVDHANGTDDTLHGGGSGKCAYRTLGYALTQAEGQIALAFETYPGDVPGEPDSYLLTGSQSLLCNYQTAGKATFKYNGPRDAVDGLVTFAGTANQMYSCVMDGLGRGGALLRVTSSGAVAPPGGGHWVSGTTFKSCANVAARIQMGVGNVGFDGNQFIGNWTAIEWVGTNSGLITNNTFAGQGNFDIYCGTTDPTPVGSGNTDNGKCKGCQKCPF